MMRNELQQLVKTAQYNCHIADARHAGDYTLCVYLLKMREMYRWEKGIDFQAQLTSDDVGDWLTEREGVWDDVEEQEYKTIELSGERYDPFDNESINLFLDKDKLVYNAGLGIRNRPHFFIAELEEVVNHEDYTIFISGKELARDMAAPPAMAQGKHIFIRRESLRRVIWEVLDDALLADLDNPLTRAMSYYAFESNLDDALNEMTEAEIEYVIQHEIGEVRAASIVGDDWNKMLASLARTQAEIMLRAVKDHLADSMTTLPELISNGASASIHFYFGNMSEMRKYLAPNLIRAYELWHENDDISILNDCLKGLQAHWLTLVDDVSRTFSASNDAASIEELIKERIL